MGIKFRRVLLMMAIAIIAILSFTANAQQVEKHGRKPTTFPSLPVTDSLTVSAENQSESPLVLSFEEVRFRDTLKPQIDFRLSNKSEKAILGFNVRYDEESSANKSSRLLFKDEFAWRTIRPAYGYTIMFPYSIKEADIRRLILSVDAVFFDDGTTWRWDGTTEQ